MARVVQINEDGEFIPVDQQQYIWLGDIIDNQVLKNVMKPGDAAIITQKMTQKSFLMRALKQSTTIMSLDSSY